MKPLFIIPRREGLEPPTEPIPKAQYQRDDSIDAAVEDYLEAKQILANAQTVVDVARKELERKLRNRVAVECTDFKVWWQWTPKKAYSVRATTTRPLRVFPKEESNAPSNVVPFVSPAKVDDPEAG